MKSNLLVVSNRGPFTIEGEMGNLKYRPAVSGLVSAVLPAVKKVGGIWLAWAGRLTEKTLEVQTVIKDDFNFVEVLLSREELKGYYEGYSNGVLWPLCHLMPEKVVLSEENYRIYKKVNQKFAQRAGTLLKPGTLLWIHDYHLALMPYFVRQKYSWQRIAFFWHIPFPPVEIFTIQPWAQEILRGLLGADLIGFHTEDYRENFLRSVERVLKIPVNYEWGTVYYNGREIRVKAVPIGIEPKNFQKDVPKIEEIEQDLRGQIIFLGVERLDYTKGLKEKILGFARFLEKNPEYLGKVILLQVAVPTRENIAAYRNYAKEVLEEVQKVNERFGHSSWQPIKILTRNYSQDELIYLYRRADTLIITSLEDGLNLVAKEFIASRQEPGVVILSNRTGVARQFGVALKVNPYSPEEIAGQIKTSLEMSLEEKEKMFAKLKEQVLLKNNEWWLDNFLGKELMLSVAPGKYYRKRGEKKIGAVD
ncbi:alpha,alpha-trehalose-phosphate synthase (UDP-forming) [Carboxydothermus pertinax]|uniref:Trehalose-6-phosphate synthase n=1 Tax=Carboxydothermus pertinax TaxID=870242 RepID=A0A1L8CSK8_9THEO|nr:trehalose-6-phosphate synthase [Carboxydothermus pertinax]GAV21906.1 trehalose-6-phosphate synthase [Carboxydothermus pertinax]